MWFEKLKIENFRRIERAELEFSPELNVIYGGNAQGKTTILRALKVLAGEENRFLLEFLRLGKSFFLLKGKIAKEDGLKSEVIASYDGQQSKRLVDGKEKSGNEIRKSFPVVSLESESVYLIKGEPGYRRKFLDEIIIYLKPHYSYLKAAYYRALQQRMKALSEIECPGKESFELYLDELEKTMSQQGAKIIKYRWEAIRKLEEKIKTLNSGTVLNEPVAFEYLTEGQEEDEVKLAIKEKLFKNRKLDREKGRTACGPHLDEVRIFFGEKVARDFASEGEQKILTFLLHLAAREVITEETGETPVLLIDDFPAVLDEKNTASLVDFLREKGQVILTVTSWEPEKMAVSSLEKASKVFQVREGEVKSGAH